jgi:hypothetical protein
LRFTRHAYHAMGDEVHVIALLSLPNDNLARRNNLCVYRTAMFARSSSEMS